MKKLTIGYFADGPWSHMAFNKIINDNRFDIKFIVPRYDTLDGTLYKFSKDYHISYFKHKNINSKEFIDKVRNYNCDLFVSMSFNQIFKTEIINTPKLKTINCHAGKLPFYRGRNILNWALINDEKEFGITVHYIDEGIDTGDIIVQKTYPITDQDNYNTLLEKAYEECANLLYEALLLILENKVKKIKQTDIHPVGFYCGARKEGDEILDWNQTSREVFNFVRAICEPGPKARSYVGNEEIKINNVKLIDKAPVYKGIPGQVLSKTKVGFYIKTRDSFVEVVDYEGKLRVGNRLKKIL